MTSEATARPWLLGESLVGRRFGLLEVVSPAEKPADAVKSKARNTYWLCRCRCGREKIVARSYLIQGNVTSCGCKKRGRPGTAKPKREKLEQPKLASSGERLATACKCASCGKTFERLSKEWVYKATIGTQLRWYCSWGCLRRATAHSGR